MNFLYIFGSRYIRNDQVVNAMHVTTAKIVMIGDNEVGKTALLQRFLAGNAGDADRFPEEYVPTLGADFQIVELYGLDSTVNLYIWDLNGHDTFKTLRLYYMHGMNAFLLLVDLTRPETLDHAYQWHEEAVAIKPDVKGIVIGTKLDGDRQVEDEAINRVAAELGCEVILASAKTGENCTLILKSIVNMIEPGVEVIKKRNRIAEIWEDLQ